MTVGVLALQGAFRAHIQILNQLDAETAEVRVPADLEGVDALVIPGGESTTISMLLESSGLFEPLADKIEKGMAVLGTLSLIHI